MSKFFRSFYHSGKSLDSSLYKSAAQINREKAQTIYPFLNRVFRENSHPELIASIDRGEHSLEKLQTLFNKPWATKGFLKRMEGVSWMPDIVLLGEALSHDLTDENGKFNDKKFGERVSNIPLDPKVRKEMWGTIDALRKCGIGAKALTHLIVNTEDKWSKNYRALTSKTSTTTSIEKFFNSITDYLIVPEFFSSVKSKYAELGEQEIPKLATNHTHFRAESVPLFHRFTSTICKFSSPRHIVLGSKNFHKASKEIDLLRPLYQRELQQLQQEGRSDKPDWHPLISNLTFEGHKIKALTNYKELEDEALAMDNCIRNAVGPINKGESFMLAIEAPDGARYTMEVSPGLRNNSAKIIELVDSDNKGFMIEPEYYQEKSLPIPPIVQTMNRFVEGMNNGTIPLNKMRGRVDYSEDSVHDNSGFDLLSDVPQKIMEVTKRKKLLPKELLEGVETPSDLVEKCGMTEEIRSATTTYVEKVEVLRKTPNKKVSNAEAEEMYDPYKTHFRDN